MRPVFVRFRAADRTLASDKRQERDATNAGSGVLTKIYTEDGVVIALLPEEDVADVPDIFGLLKKSAASES